jgi:hypothetical protein
MGADEQTEPEAKTVEDLGFVFGPEVLAQLAHGYKIVELPNSGQLALIAPSPIEPAA